MTAKRHQSLHMDNIRSCPIGNSYFVKQAPAVNLKQSIGPAHFCPRGEINGVFHVYDPFFFIFA